MTYEFYKGATLSVLFSTPITAEGSRQIITGFNPTVKVGGYICDILAIDEYSFRATLAASKTLKLEVGNADIVLYLEKLGKVSVGKVTGLIVIEPATDTANIDDTSDVVLTITELELQFDMTLNNLLTYQDLTTEEIAELMSGVNATADALFAEMEVSILNCNTATQGANEATNLANEATVLATDATTLATQAAALANEKAEEANTAATRADSSADDADEAAGLANDAADLANEKAGDANEAAILANEKAGEANTQALYAKEQGDYALEQGDYAKAQGEAANTAAGVANSAKGWTPLFVDVADGLRIVRKLDSYVGGTGDAPTLNVGKYLKSDGTYTSVIADAANYKGVAGEVSNAILINTEEALANVLNTMRGEINALKQVIAQGVLTKVQIGEADIQKLKYQGSEMTLSGVGVPSVIPDFIGQRYVQVGVKVWESVGISSVADWK